MSRTSTTAGFSSVEGQAVNQWNETPKLPQVKGPSWTPGAAGGGKDRLPAGTSWGKRPGGNDRESIQKSLSSPVRRLLFHVNARREIVPFMVSSRISPRTSRKKQRNLPSLSDFSVEVISSKKGSK